jgi:hypothetical protein
MDQERTPRPAPREYTPEFRERAMRLVSETIEAEGRSHGVVTVVRVTHGARAGAVRQAGGRRIWGGPWHLEHEPVRGPRSGVPSHTGGPE